MDNVADLLDDAETVDDNVDDNVAELVDDNVAEVVDNVSDGELVDDVSAMLDGDSVDNVADLIEDGERQVRTASENVGARRERATALVGTVVGGSAHSVIAGKDKTVAELIPDLITPCALGVGGSTCVGEKTITVVARHLGIADVDPVKVIEAARAATNCGTEKCAVTAVAAELTGADHAVISSDIAISYKVAGPTGTKLLSNFNIDAGLRQWAATRPDFFPYNFNMRDYASNSFVDRTVVHQPDTLATVAWADLARRGIRRAACVINSDVYSGPGKHWMALFADTTADPPSVEFFNSSGSAPAAEWVNWLVKTRAQIDAVMGSGSSGSPAKPCRIVKVTSIRHQDSKSECGVYSLFYIWARLHGVPPEYFMKTPVPDQLMFEFRQHLFDDKARPELSEPRKFDWNAYKGTVRIEWE